jgi:hypothetical protein
LVGVGLTALATGCGSDSGLLDRSGEAITLDAFVDPAATPAAGEPAPPQVVDVEKPESPAGPVADLGVVPSGATGSAAVPAMQERRLVTSVGGPPPVAQGAPAVESVLVESLVGQINGRPVYASEILEPLDGRLRQAGTQARSEAQWRREAAQAIVQELRTRIEDELVLAEARRSLTPEQKQGLFRFLAQIQQNLVAGQRGSEIAADESLREATGQGLRERAQSELDKALIVKELRERVGARIVVSWRDIQQAYERDFDKFNPPAVALVRLISVESSNAAGVQAITDALASGKPFAEVAKMEPNTYLRSEGGKLERKFSGAFVEGEYSPIPDLNQAIRSLNVGQTIGPITYNPRPIDPDAPTATPAPDPKNLRTGWVYLERIDRPDGVSLYDAQLQLDNQLRNARTNAEVTRYIESLRRRGNISKVEVMAERLMTIATDRYAPRFKSTKE